MKDSEIKTKIKQLSKIAEKLEEAYAENEAVASYFSEACNNISQAIEALEGILEERKEENQNTSEVNKLYYHVSGRKEGRFIDQWIVNIFSSLEEAEEATLNNPRVFVSDCSDWLPEEIDARKRTAMLHE